MFGLLEYLSGEGHIVPAGCGDYFTYCNFNSVPRGGVLLYYKSLQLSATWCSEQLLPQVRHFQPGGNFRVVGQH